MTDTEARRLAEQCIADADIEDDEALDGYMERQAIRAPKLARHLLALLERTRLTASERSVVTRYQRGSRHEADQMFDIISRLTTQPEAGGGWQDIASAPKGRKILLYYTQSNGVGRTIIGQYYLSGTLEWSDESPEYCEGDGFAPEGWYEESETHEDIRPIEYAPTHWMPLPSAPLPNSGGGE